MSRFVDENGKVHYSVDDPMYGRQTCNKGCTMTAPEPLLNAEQQSLIENSNTLEKEFDEQNNLMPCDLRHELIVQENKEREALRINPAKSSKKKKEDDEPAPLLPCGMN